MNNFWKDLPEVEQFLDHVQEAIRESIHASSSYIRPMLMEMVEKRGKMLRPAMIYAASLTGAGKPADTSLIRDLAAAMEMLHMASLVHDDVIDDAALRRGTPTLQSKTTVKKAVIAGDYLLTRAFTRLTARSRSETDSINPDIIRNSICRLCDSEIDQDSELWDFSISEAHYLRRIAGKTAALFSLSLYLGSSAAEAPDAVQCLMRRIGYCVGMAFQIQDDILDYTSDETRIGKPSGNDLKCGIATLPLIYALRDDSTGKLEKLLRGRKKLGRRTAAAVTRKVVDLGGLSRAGEKSLRYWNRVRSHIDDLENREAADILRYMVTKLENRS